MSASIHIKSASCNKNCKKKNVEIFFKNTIYYEMNNLLFRFNFQKFVLVTNKKKKTLQFFFFLQILFGFFFYFILKVFHHFKLNLVRSCCQIPQKVKSTYVFVVVLLLAKYIFHRFIQTPHAAYLFVKKKLGERRVYTLQNSFESAMCRFCTYNILRCLNQHTQWTKVKYMDCIIYGLSAAYVQYICTYFVFTYLYILLFYSNFYTYIYVFHVY